MMSLWGWDEEDEENKLNALYALASFMIGPSAPLQILK